MQWIVCIASKSLFPYFFKPFQYIFFIFLLFFIYIFFFTFFDLYSTYGRKVAFKELTNNFYSISVKMCTKLEKNEF